MPTDLFKRFYAVGSTTADEVTGYPVKAIKGQKDPIAFEYDSTGGGGANFTITLNGLKKVLGGEFEVKLATSMGPHLSEESHPHLSETTIRKTNEARERAQEDLDGTRVFDFHRGVNEFRFPRNKVTVWDGDRHVGVTNDFNKTAIPMARGAERDMEVDVKYNVDDLFIHSTFATASLTALEAAHEAESLVTSMLDYSAKNPANGGNQDKLLRLKPTTVVAPVEAKVPGMDMSPDVIAPDELFERLHAQYGIQQIAVSGGSDPIRVFDHGDILQIPITRADKVVDTLGCGDTRNAALFYFTNYHGDDFITALKKSAAVATFAIQFKNRDWLTARNPETKELLFIEFLKADPLFEDNAKFFQNPDSPGEDAPEFSQPN